MESGELNTSNANSTSSLRGAASATRQSSNVARSTENACIQHQTGSPRCDRDDNTFFRRLLSLPSLILIGLITGYRKLISPFFAPRCRFHPTCSAYAIEALQTHGFFRGSWLALRRITHCHPLGKFGDDPVPHKDC